VKRLLAFCLLVGTMLKLTGFNLDHAIVPEDEVMSGGVPKDGIPALMKPEFVASGEARFLNPEDEGIGVELGGEAKAYPIKILNWHEVVNDTIEGTPVVVTF